MINIDSLASLYLFIITSCIQFSMMLYYFYKYYHHKHIVDKTLEEKDAIIAKLRLELRSLVQTIPTYQINKKVV